MVIKNCTDKIILRSIEIEDIFALWKVAFNGDLEWMKWKGPYFQDPVHSLEAFTKIAEKHYVGNPFSAVIEYEVIQNWITYLFELIPHIQRACFTTWSGNKGMMKVGEKIGMTKEAQIRQVRYYQNKYDDSVKYGVLREEW